MKLVVDSCSSCHHGSNSGFRFYFGGPPLPEATSDAMDDGGPMSECLKLFISCCARVFEMLSKSI